MQSNFLKRLTFLVWKITLLSLGQIRAEIISALMDFYQQIPAAKYYEVAPFTYKHSNQSNRRETLIHGLVFV